MYNPVYQRITRAKNHMYAICGKQPTVVVISANLIIMLGIHSLSGIDMTANPLSIDSIDGMRVVIDYKHDDLISVGYDDTEM